ncbi:MAG TPA: multiheme c-type cytochrome [Anaeromyxobacter sp.]|nr:multiheme c-type cytochrome [Anaeromyxobacter sp.]
MSPRLALALRAAAALALAAPLPASAGPAARGRGHLDVKGEQDCAACHRTDTPEVFAAWEASPHGLALVKCVVCHGSTGKDFRARPDASRCRGCHAALVESLPARAGRDCFACHAPHSLASNPHR